MNGKTKKKDCCFISSNKFSALSEIKHNETPMQIVRINNNSILPVSAFIHLRHRYNDAMNKAKRKFNIRKVSPPTICII